MTPPTVSCRRPAARRRGGIANGPKCDRFNALASGPSGVSPDHTTAPPHRVDATTSHEELTHLTSLAMPIKSLSSLQDSV